MPETDNNDKLKKDYRPLPDLAACRALRVLPTLVECLVMKGHLCPYSTPFGSGLFCEHPERDQIVARTKAEREKPRNGTTR